ncbi:MAG: DNA methyltransferase [Promethearchaeota archaeon]
MVKLTWENKSNISKNIKDLKLRYLDYFETVNLGLGDFQGKKWKNLLFWGENLKVLQYLTNNFSEKIDLIYIDPPFFSGTNYKIKIEENGYQYDSIAYVDHWNKDIDSYLQMLRDRIILFRELLSINGLLFIHLDWHASHYVRVLLDEIFGANRFVNSIVWYYYNKYSAGKKNLPRAHDDILVYSKSANYTFNELRSLRKKPIKQLKRIMVDGVLKNAKDEKGHTIYRIVKDKKMDDVWKIPCMQPASKEWTGFPTQKHHDLLERIVKIGSNEGDLVADFFCGSGTTLLAADKLNRRWIGCDISEYSIYLTRKRLLNYRKKVIDQVKKLEPIEIYTHLDEQKKNLLSTGFFEKDLKIRRKK